MLTLPSSIIFSTNSISVRSKATYACILWGFISHILATLQNPKHLGRRYCTLIKHCKELFITPSLRNIYKNYSYKHNSRDLSNKSLHRFDTSEVFDTPPKRTAKRHGVTLGLLQWEGCNFLFLSNYIENPRQKKTWRVSIHFLVSWRLQIWPIKKLRSNQGLICFLVKPFQVNV